MNQEFHIKIINGRWTVNGKTFNKFTIPEYVALLEHIKGKPKTNT